MTKCKDCNKNLYFIEVIDDRDDKICIDCARKRYPNEEAFEMEDNK